MDDKIDMDFIKTLKAYRITYLSELPSKDVKVEENTVIAVPGKKQGQFILYTWFENEWVLTATIDKSDFELRELKKELKKAHNDLNNAVKKLTKIAADTEDEELFSKLSKITTKIFQAMNELSDDIIDPLESSKSEEQK